MLFVQPLDSHPSVGAAQDGFAGLRCKAHAGPDGLRVSSLHDQHIKPVACFGLFRVCQPHSRCDRRVIDRVKHVLGLMRQKMQRGRLFLGKHADRRGIEHDLDVARDMPTAEHGYMCAGQDVTDLPLQGGSFFKIAPGDGQVCALRGTVICHHRSGAAVAKQQYLFAAQGNAVPLERFGKAEDISVVPDGLSLHKSDGID